MKQRGFEWVALLLVGALSATGVHAKILSVPNDFTKIQQAIDAAERLDEIVIEPGVYFESGIDFGGKRITVRSTDPGDPAVVAATIIDGGGAARVFRFGSGEEPTSVLAGLTITGGEGTEGGGIRIEDSSPTIDRCVIRDNHASKGGGGIYCSGAGSAPVITHSEIRDNRATSIAGKGGPADLSPTLARLLAHRFPDGPPPIDETVGGGLKAVRCSPIIEDSIFSGNHAGQGGGIGLRFSAARIRRTTISGNDAVWGGGLHLREARRVTIEDSVVTGNVADFGAGGLGIEQSDARIDRIEISDNLASGFGAGMVISNASPLISNALFVRNVNDGDGGALAVVTDASPDFVHVTLSANSAVRGGGLIVADGATATFTNSILWANAPEEIVDFGGTVTVTYSVIAGGWPGDGNLDADPLFVSPGVDLHLQSGSPAIDTALAESGDNDDIDGQIRPGGPEFDMGSDEFFGPPQILEVPGAFALIQEAIDAAFNGDEVIVAAGVHVEHDIDFRGKAVTVRSTDPADPAVVAATVVDGGGLGSVFRFVSGESTQSVLAGLTVTGGAAFDGGGIYISASSPTIDRCTVSGNEATFGNGGGIYSDNGSMLVVSTTVSGNSAADCAEPEAVCGSGGGVFATGGAPTIEDSTISGNTAAVWGGGIYQTAGAIVGGTVSQNTAIDGGGIFAVAIEIEGTHVGPDNAASADGGGIYGEDSEIHDATIDANEADRGGGLILLDSLLLNSTVTGNHAVDEGGGVWAGEVFNCLIQENSSDGDGGGAAKVDLIEESVVLDNLATSRGGGLSNPQIVRECEVRGNEADTGGGIYSQAALADEAVIKDSLVTANSARLGGGIATKAPWPPPDWADPLPLKVRTSEVSFNTADESGGAIYCQECIARVTQSRITDNSSGFQGGAVWVTPTTSQSAKPELVIEATTMSRNSTVESGGALFCGVQAVVRVTNAEVSGNSAVDGGAFYSDSCDLQILNSTLTLNQASGEGGALLTTSTQASGGRPDIRNSILWGDTPDEIVVISLGLPKVLFSDVQGGWAGAGNIDADPLFVNAGPIDGDFHLSQISPCIDAANSAVAPDEDLDGDRRPVGEGDDIGADEFAFANPEDRTPEIEAIDPDRGSVEGGETVILTGASFGTFSRVFFAAAEASVSSVTPTTLEVVTPQSAGSGLVNVEVRNLGSFSAIVQDGFEYVLPAPPVVTSVVPNSGSIEGGETVSVFGQGFHNPMKVYFGLSSGLQVQLISPTELTVTTPQGAAAGPVDVVVENPYGQTGVLPDGFTYVLPAPPAPTSVTPGSGPVSGGTAVQILGTGFSAGVTVRFGLEAATQVTFVSEQELAVTTPPSAIIGPVDVVVTDAYGQDGILPGGFEYLAEVDPEIFELDPPSGSTGGGETVVIHGQGFADPMLLLVDGREVEVVFIDDSTLQFVTPSQAAGADCVEIVVEVKVVRSDGKQASADFTYVPAQVVSVGPGESIQAVIDTAAQGACILLAENPFPGYLENLEIGDKAMAIYGASPEQPSLTVINGSSGSGPVVRYTSNQRAGSLLHGIALVLGDGGIELNSSSPRLQDLLIQDNHRGGDGGGISVLGTSEPTLVDSVVSANTSNDDGGGIYIASGAAMILEGNVISLNQADDGGGLWIGSDVVLSLADQVIEFNQATLDDGGGIYADSRVTLVLDGVEIRGNSAADDGGGILLLGHAVLTATDTLVEANLADGVGGGIATSDNCDLTFTGGSISTNLAGLGDSLGSGGGLYAGQDSRIEIVGASIEMNATLSASSQGGGIYLAGFVSGSIEDSRIAGNLAQIGGGLALTAETDLVLSRNEIACNQSIQNADPGDPDPPAFYAPGLYLENSRSSVYNNTVYGNTGGDGVTASGGLHLEAPFLFPELVNNLFAANEGYGLYCAPGALLGRLDYNLYHGNTEGDVANCVAGTNAVFDDPLVIDPSCPGPDLGLQPGSPAIDAGDPGFPVPPGGGATIDIGANEHQL